MSTLRGGTASGAIRAGVQTAAQVTVAPSAPSGRITLWDAESGSMWAFVLFVAAFILLYVVL